MKDDTMTAKDAFFALDTDMTEDMESYSEEVTMYVIKHINSTPKLYEEVKGLKPSNIKATCIGWAMAHNNEFGDYFQSELDVVDWKKVGERV